jgi:hypothetical protein
MSGDVKLRPDLGIQMNRISIASRIPFLTVRPAPVRSPSSAPAMSVRLGLRRQSRFLPRLRAYSPLAQKELDPQLNGYPQLPAISRQSLPAKGWWDIQMRRNLGDTV